MDKKVDLTGATVIIMRPGDALTFVLQHELVPWEADQMMEELQKIFPTCKVNIVSSCQQVIHESQSL